MKTLKEGTPIEGKPLETALYMELRPHGLLRTLRLDWARGIGLANNASDDAKAKNRLWFMVGKVW